MDLNYKLVYGMMINKNVQLQSDASIRSPPASELSSVQPQQPHAWGDPLRSAAQHMLKYKQGFRKCVPTACYSAVCYQPRAFCNV